MDRHETVVHALQHWAETDPTRDALWWSDTNLDVVDSRTYGALFSNVVSIAQVLRARFEPQSRFLLLHPPGIAAVEAFLGCVAADMVAVPAYPPDPFRLQRSMERLVDLAGNCDPAAILTEAFIDEHRALLIEHAPTFEHLDWIRTDSIDPLPSRAAIDASGTSAAFLQYSSGSTGSPKGVVVTHRNITANVEAISQAFEIEPDDIGFSWLPTYHDMGLIGTVLAPVYCGLSTYLMSPVDFLRDPSVWVRAISRFGCSISGGPNFAYELCVRRTPPEVRDRLDLSTWRVAFNGAEPVDPATLDGFSREFATAGFRRRAHLPCYGLAEATLLVASTAATADPRVLRVERTRLGAGVVQLAGEEGTGAGGEGAGGEVASCGRPVPSVAVRICDPATGDPVPDEGVDGSVVGEIQVAGPSVAAGYWNNPEETARAFIDTPSGRWLRTGDLGAMVDGELLAVGRIKDVLVVRGANVHPHDVERAVDGAHDAIRPGCCAVFAADPGRDERAVVAVEVAEGAGPAPIIAARVAAAATGAGVDVCSVVLLAPRGLPKTSSGKVRRSATRAAWAAGTLDAVFEHHVGAPSTADCSYARSEAPASPEEPERRASASMSKLGEWLQATVAELAGGAASDVDASAAFADLGLDSLQLVELHERLEGHVGRAVPMNLVWAHPSIETLAAALVDQRPEDQPDGFGERPESDAGSVDIVGIGVRIRAVSGPAAFWELLAAGDPAGVLAPVGDLGAGDAGRFDARFFGISPREARRIDPQHRWFLEVAIHAIEDAGIDPASLAGTRTGVFLGASPSEYPTVAARTGTTADMHTVTGMSPALAANRLSYLLDLRGPSMTVDTACSSSLVALHLAVTSLRRAECELAVVGGVNLIVGGDVTDGLRSAGALSATGRCHTFDAAADGYVRGSGCGVVILERSRRETHRRVYATVAGSATNQDGRTNGLTAPNPVAQRDVIAAALRSAGNTAADVVTVEAHGTGTPLGDPIETSALTDVFAAAAEPVTVTSVKAIVGHLEAAAGIIGVIKTALSAHRGVVCPQPHFDTLNPAIDRAGVLDIPTVAQPWSVGVAGVSSFGIGGTNAHAVIARPPTRPTPQPESGMGVVSGVSEEALRGRLVQLGELAAAHGDGPAAARMAAVAGRHRFRAVVDPGNDGLAVAAARAANDTHLPTAKRGRLVAVAAGQGTGAPSLGPNTGNDRVFVEHLELLSAAVGAVRGRSLAEWTGLADAPTDVTQPLLTALTLATHRSLVHAGVGIDAVVGHSVGEIAALAIAGGVDDIDAVRFAARRGAVMATGMQPGAMLNVFAGVDDVTSILGDTARRGSIAAINAPTSVVVAGSEADVAELVDHCERRRIRAIRVGVGLAFHSAAVERCRDQILEIAESLLVAPTCLELVSTVDGVAREPGWVPAASYWWEHARRPVCFDAAVRAAGRDGPVTFLEIAPGATFARLRRREREAWEVADTCDLGSDAHHRMLGRLFLAGHPIHWNRVVTGSVPDIDLPPYPFGGDIHWITPEATAEGPGEQTAPPIAAVRASERRTDPVRDLRVALNGFGAGPEATIVLDDLTPTAEAVAVGAASAIGARWVHGSPRTEWGTGCLRVAHTSRAERPARTVVLDTAGLLPDALHLTARRPSRRPDLSLAFFGVQVRGRERLAYTNLFDAVLAADRLGYTAVWTPERHFDSFGGAFPAPAVLSAALAHATTNLQVRAGSVVLPLTNPLRVVEEWALVDNLSDGRAGVAFASGWRDRDRLLAATAERPAIDESIELIRRLWSGDAVRLDGPGGISDCVQVQPAPVQATLPMWLTVMNNPDSWERAARLDLGVFTNMIGRSTDALAERVAADQAARADAGHGPGPVTVMLHAHVAHTRRAAMETARSPLEDYLAASAALFSSADVLPQIARRLDAMSETERADEIRAVARLSAERYLSGPSLIGDAASCADLLDSFADIGVTEVACLVDFGPDRSDVLSTIEQLATLTTAGPRACPGSLAVSEGIPA